MSGSNLPTETNAFWMGDTYSPQMNSMSAQPKTTPQADTSVTDTAGASSLGWLGGPKGAAAMAALQMISQAAERQRKERLMEYESRVQRLKSQQQAAAAGQQMAQALRF